MNSILAKYGNLPVSTATLALEFPNIRKPGQKLGLLERDGDIIRLKRGLYVCSDPEKALCDLIANTPSLFLRYRKEALAYLEEDLRFDMDSFYKLNPIIFSQYVATHGKKATSVNTILKSLTEHG